MAWKLSGNRGVDFKNTGLAKSTPCGTVCLEDGLMACMLLDVSAVQAHALRAWNGWWTTAPLDMTYVGMPILPTAAPLYVP